MSISYVRKSVLSAGCAGLLLSGAAGADTVTGGSLSMSLNQAAWDNINDLAAWQAFTGFTGGTNGGGQAVPVTNPGDPVLFPGYDGNGPFMTFTGFFDDASLPVPALLSGAVAPATTDPTSLSLDVFSGTPPAGGGGRNPQATNLSFNQSDVEGTASGQIGLGGIARWQFDPFLAAAVSAAPSWQLLTGDFSLSFDSARQIGANSGWFFENNAGFPLAMFDTRNVTVTASDGSLLISGDLFIAGDAGTPGVRDSFAENFALLTDVQVGSFSLGATTAVPVPAAVWLFASGLAGMTLVGRRRDSRSRR